MYLQWVTSTAPEHGLTNISVLLNGKHVVQFFLTIQKKKGIPLVFGTKHLPESEHMTNLTQLT
jgi:hypothetical protein